MGAQLALQLKSVAFAATFAVVMTVGIALVLKALMGLRVGVEDEDLGLDLSEHSETAYSFGAGSASFVERATEDYGAAVPSMAPARKPA
jgi:Amt family ammonium transporter